MIWSAPSRSLVDHWSVVGQLLVGRWSVAGGSSIIRGDLHGFNIYICVDFKKQVDG